MRLGDLEVLPLSTGQFRLDGGAMFGVVPKVLWARHAPADDRNRIRLESRSLLIRGRGRHVLIDAGIGSKLGPKEREIFDVQHPGTLDLSLAAHGLTVADIDLVVATHLHFDHAGGFTELVDGAVRPRFPRARYAIRRHEWEDATHPNARTRASYIPDNVLPLAEADVVDLIDEDTEILPGVRLVRTGGHTRDHQIVRIEGGGRVAVFAADLMPTKAHVQEAWGLGFDLYPLETMRYKRGFVDEAIAGEYVIFFQHDPEIAAGVIRRDGTRPRVETVDPASMR